MTPKQQAFVAESDKHYIGSPCKKCGESLRYFSDKSCVACRKKKIRERWENNPDKIKKANKRWSENNPNKASEYSMRWRQNNIEHARHVDREYSARYRNANPKSTRAAVKKWQKSNPEKIRKANRRWEQENPNKRLAQVQRRRARKNNAHSEPYDFMDICNKFGNRCLGCGAINVDLTVDHVIPLSKGGADIAENIQPLCLSCNSSKKDKTIDYR